MKKYLIFCASVLFIIPIASAQSLYDGTEMDFWIGEWELSWVNNNQEPGRGINKVEKILDGVVILENFEALEGSYKGFKGKSFSVYNSRQDKWFQTWVDSSEGYLPFEFEMEGDKRIFIREATAPDGQIFWTRMVFYNITHDSFVWDWQKSVDGKNWTTTWQIHYKRKRY